MRLKGRVSEEIARWKACGMKDVAEPPWVVCSRNPLTPKRQVGAVCPGPQDEPVIQDRDSSLGIAYSLRDVRTARAGQSRLLSI